VYKTVKFYVTQMGIVQFPFSRNYSGLPREINMPMLEREKFNMPFQEIVGHFSAYTGVTAACRRVNAQHHLRLIVVLHTSR